MIIFEYPSLHPQISFLLFYPFLGSSHYRDWLGSLPSESAFHPIYTASRSPPLFLLLNLLKVCFLTFQTPPQVPQTQLLLLNQHKWLSYHKVVLGSSEALSRPHLFNHFVVNLLPSLWSPQPFPCEMLYVLLSLPGQGSSPPGFGHHL